jgi:ABC transporter substrate binding protein (PQQ-dependent alcohol dehydrogenase system)
VRVLLVSGLLALSQSFAQIGEVRVGAVLPPGASPALEAVRNGLRMGEKEYDLNARLLGGRFQVLIRSAQTATAAAQAADSLVAQGASALVGGFSGQAPALARVAQARRIPFLNIGDPSDRLRNEACNPYMFHLEASAAMYLDALATWFVRAGLRTWFLVYGGPEGGDLRARARKALLERHFGARIVGEKEVQERAFQEVLQAIRRAQPQVVLLLLPPEAQLAFLGQYERVGLDAQVTGFPYPEAQTRAFFRQALARAPRSGAGYRVVLWEAKLDAYGARELNARYLEMFGLPMDPPAWAAYQAVKILFEAVAFTQSKEGRRIRAHLLDPQAVFDVHKGIGVSFRPWDQQLRQALYLVKLASAKEAWDLASLVGELPAIYRPGTDPVERLDQLGDLKRDSRCRLGGG